MRDEATAGSWQRIYAFPERFWLAYWVAHCVALLFAWDRIGDAPRLLIGNLALMTVMVVVPPLTYSFGTVATQLGRALLTFLCCLLSFERVSAFVTLWRDQSYELLMLKSDALIFGGNPSVWVQQFHHPLLTEYLQVLYVFYFPSMLIVALVMMWQRNDEDFYEYLLAMNLSFCCLHVAYVLVPVRSPFLVADLEPWSHYIQYTTPLYGLWYTDAIRQHLLDVTTMRYDCFPSGHTMGMVLSLMYALRTNRATIIFSTICTVSIIFSTLYLRYHYGTDLLAGGAAAVFFYQLAGWLRRKDVEVSQEPVEMVTA